MIKSNTSTGKPKRGVALYSYQGEFMTTMTLEDIFADMYDMGRKALKFSRTHTSRITRTLRMPGWKTGSDFSTSTKSNLWSMDTGWIQD
jgi:hypothetical protein